VLLATSITSLGAFAVRRAKQCVARYAVRQRESGSFTRQQQRHSSAESDCALWLLIAVALALIRLPLSTVCALPLRVGATTGYLAALRGGGREVPSNQLIERTTSGALRTPTVAAHRQR
jgi:hypothetical protein